VIFEVFPEIVLTKQIFMFKHDNVQNDKQRPLVLPCIPDSGWLAGWFRDPAT
jgi:hypothetical protein